MSTGLVGGVLPVLVVEIEFSIPASDFGGFFEQAKGTGHHGYGSACIF